MFLKLFLLGLALTLCLLLILWWRSPIRIFKSLYILGELFFCFIFSSALVVTPETWNGLGYLLNNLDISTGFSRHTLKIDLRMYKAAMKDKVPTKRKSDMQNLSKLNKTSILSIGITGPCSLDICLPVNSSSTVIVIVSVKYDRPHVIKPS